MPARPHGNSARYTTISSAGAGSAACIGALPRPTAPLAAQTLVLSLGDSARVQVAPGTKVTVPLSVNLSAAAGTSLASLQGRVTWAASQLTLDSVRATGSAGWTVLSNLDSVAQGRAGVVTYGAAALPASGPIGALYFTATATNGGTRVSFTPAPPATRAARACSRGCSCAPSTPAWPPAGNGATPTTTAP